MKTGKLPHNLLAEMLSNVPLDARVLVGPGIGIDAAVIDFGERLLVTKTDPITFATDLIGWYAVNVNANDIAVMGAEPKWFMATILLPQGTEEEIVRGLFDQITSACEDLGISLIGGHTEITHDLNRPVIVGCMLGETDRAHLVTASGARVGDDILVTKGIAVEGTSLLAREAGDRLRGMGFTEEFLRKAANYLFDPGISVIPDARLATANAHVHAMHDPTEGGLATGLMEIAEASGLGLEIRQEAIPILPETQTLCRELKLDPLGLIASGSLVLTCDPADTPRLLEAFAQDGLRASVIGRMMPKDHGLKMLAPTGLADLPSFPRDEIARFFDDAF
jgi:hydrogenase expression/formation protein HypE